MVDRDEDESLIWRRELMCMFFSFSSDTTSWAKENEAPGLFNGRRRRISAAEATLFKT